MKKRTIVRAIFFTFVTVIGTFFFASRYFLQPPQEPSAFLLLSQTEEWYPQNINHHFYEKFPALFLFYDPGEPISQQAIIELNKAILELKSKVIFRGIHCTYSKYDQTEKGLKSFQDRFNPAFPFVIDSNHTIQNQFNVTKLPTVLLFVPPQKNPLQYSSITDLNALQAHIIADIGNQKELPRNLAVDYRLPNQKDQKAAKLFFPTKLVVKKSNGSSQEPSLFIADSGNNRIIEISLDGTLINQFGSGKAGYRDGEKSEATFNWPTGLAYTDFDNKLYCADRHNHRLRVIDLTTETISTCVGNGVWGHETMVRSDQNPLFKSLSLPTDVSQFLKPDSIAFAQAGNHEIWIYETLRKRLRPLAGNGKNFLKDGILPYNGLMTPLCLSLHKNTLIIADQMANAIRTMPAYNLTTLVGNQNSPHGFLDGPTNECRMERPAALCSDGSRIFVADTNNHAVRIIDTHNLKVATLCGNGFPGKSLGNLNQVQLHCPQGIAYHDNHLFIADTHNHRIIMIDLTNQVATECNILTEDPLV